ncbi:putative phosphatidylglycerol/phosphatidylinositol transfer protein DDB_G0282107 [Halichondria panicea]|uniref:putative phosphatidylglycerol/phosphatidylinositol transfer protein DDB_G0282107 n=1 Tax=Halichondria panicea TaxID=6063 RepID=UPI00312BC7DC
MTRSVCVLAALCLLLSTSHQAKEKVTWHDCGKPTDLGKVHNITVDPNPLHVGPVVVTGNFTLYDHVTRGSRVETVINMGLYSFKQVYSFCDMAGLVSLSCPFKKGPLEIVYKAPDSQTGPIGSIYKIDAVIKDQNGKQLFCLNMTIPL